MVARQHVHRMLKHLQSGGMEHILYSQLYLQVTGLARLQGAKLCWRAAHRWSSNGKSSWYAEQNPFQQILPYFGV